MDKVKESVSKVLSRDGKHDTTIHEKVNPAVTNETVQQTQHDKAYTAVDREVHQDHYHTSEQPIAHSETLPEQHHHKVIPVEHRSFEHGDTNRAKEAVRAEHAQYRDTSTRVEGEHTRSAEPTVAGEHVHHHVHETVQPIVQKQTIEPHVVHTTVPIHEVHHNKEQHHSASALPAVSMDEFKKRGGALEGRSTREETFEGEPRHFGNSGPGQTDSAGSVGLDGHGTKPHHDVGRTNLNQTTPGALNTSTNTTTSTSTTGHNTGSFGHLEDSNRGSTTGSSTAGKPSLMDKINPKVDSNNDGQPGFMK